MQNNKAEPQPAKNKVEPQPLPKAGPAAGNDAKAAQERARLEKAETDALTKKEDAANKAVENINAEFAKQGKPARPDLNSFVVDVVVNYPFIAKELAKAAG